MSKTLIVAIYSHPEYYPPTLNALEYLSRDYDTIYLVHRNITGFDWQYPPNVHLVSQKKLLPVREAEKTGFLKKIFWFASFTMLFFSLVRKHKPDTILFYDCMPLLSYRLFHFFMTKPNVLWYHNHDIADPAYLKKNSLTWWAWKSESWIFPKLDLFTLPAVERKTYFPMENLKGRFFFLPNFPSVKIYERYNNVKKDKNYLKILYQGSIGEQHGLEEIIPLLGTDTGQREWQLILKGFIDPVYLQRLQDLAKQYNVAGKLIYKGPGGYREVIENAAGCHIGIGIHKKPDVMNKTLGTASNKIYEYAATGMPVLLYSNEHFKEHLGTYKWAFFTDCTASSLITCLKEIVKDYENMSRQARNDFATSLNFEYYFMPLMKHLHKG